MKKQLITIALALLTAGALSTSCSCDFNIFDTTQQPSGNTITFTATLAPKGGTSRDQSGTRSGFGEAQPAFGEAKDDDGGTTRAITPGTDANSKEILNVAWASGEKIALYYQTASGYAKATATVQSVDPTTGAATIEASLNANTTNGGTIKFVYPASLANETGDDIDETKLLSQNGNLTGANGISTKFDAATGEGKIHLNGGTALPISATVTNTAGTGNVSLQSCVCICKFQFDILESAGLSGPERMFNPIIIRDGNGHTYTITSDKDDGMGGTRGFKRSDDIYIALLPVSGKTVSFYHSSVGSGGYNNYIYTSSNTTLTAGKFYRNLSIDMVKDADTSPLPFKDLAKGSVNAVDGDIIYMSSTAATANTITIADGATVTLEGVNIDATGSAGIICSGTATINLIGTNRVRTMVAQCPGIQAGGSGKTLTIQGGGSLYARGGGQAAGIGTGFEGTCGNIIVSGGSITARGGTYAAGIGSGRYGKFESINITDGINSVTATTCIMPASSYDMPDPIGKGVNDTGSGSVTIDGTTSWTAGTATTHLNWDVQSNFTDDANNLATRWTLTHK